MKIDSNGIWIIGDVHGEYDKLVELLDKLPKDANICFTGDLIDRGKKSAHVVEYVMKNGWDCVLGNHELMMIKGALDESEKSLWKQNGGTKTIKSYYKFKREIFANHVRYMRKLPYFKYYEVEGADKPLVVSHSYIHHVWVDKNHIYDELSGDDILWRHMNNSKLFDVEKEKANGIFNIFGHSPISKIIVTDTLAMIDTGACFNDKEKFGILSAIHYPSMEVVGVKNQ